MGRYGLPGYDAPSRFADGKPVYRVKTWHTPNQDGNHSREPWPEGLYTFPDARDRAAAYILNKMFDLHGSQ